MTGNTEKPFFVFITDNELIEIMSDNKIYMTESEVKVFYNICNLLFKRRGYKPKHIKEIRNGLKTIEIGTDIVFTNAGTKEKTTDFVRSAFIQDIRFDKDKKKIEASLKAISDYIDE